MLHDLRVRRRHATKPTSDKYARDIVSATAKFILWIHAQQLTLATIRQEHLDRWLAEPNNTRRLVRPFLTWTSKGGITTPLAVYRGPEPRTGASLTSEDRVQLIRRLLADETLALRTRIAGLLILLYGQPLARIVRTRTDQIHRERSQVSLLLGRDKLLLPEPIDHLILRYLAELHANTLHDQPATPWLFPGMIAGAPITAERLRRRLVRDLDHLPIRPSRNSAVANLLRDVPAPVLADLLGFSQDRAHLWAQLAATDLASYVAARQDVPRPG